MSRASAAGAMDQEPLRRIGAVQIGNPFVLAPMAGVTDLAFRLLCREAGAGLVATEMLSDLALLSGSRRSRAMLQISPYEHPVSCQLCGSRPQSMAAAAQLIAEAGADIVDINMGCPAPKIVGNNEGAALMRQPELAVEIVQAVREALPISVPVTAKIRAGWDVDSINAVELAQRLERAGVAALTVHGRVRSQFYSGQADWSIIAAVKKALDVPVIGNGDVRTAQDALAMLQTTGSDLVMIGRGVLGNPSLFTSCLSAWQARNSGGGDRVDSGDDFAERLENQVQARIAVRHLRMSVAAKGPWRGVVEMRKHGAWYLSGRRGAARLRRQLMTAEEPGEVEAHLYHALAGPPGL